MKKVLFVFALLLSGLAFSAFVADKISSNTVVISGYVDDSNGDVLEGVRIQDLSNPSNYDYTDSRGYYEITISKCEGSSSSTSLQFSHSDCHPETRVVCEQSDNTLDVTLERK